MVYGTLLGHRFLKVGFAVVLGVVIFFASRKSLKINTHLDDKSLDFYTDSDVLTDIVLKNVIHNAINYSEVGGTIEIKVWDNESWIYIKVQDFGIGIPIHLQESLYHFSRENIREGTLGEIGTGWNATHCEVFK